MLSAAAQIVFERLKAYITDTATPGLSGVKVWHEERPQQQGGSYVVFSVDAQASIGGNAPIRNLIADVECYAGLAAAADEIAQAAAAALEGYSAASNDVRVMGLTLNGSNRGFSEDANLWYVSLRVQGLGIG